MARGWPSPGSASSRAISGAPPTSRLPSSPAEAGRPWRGMKAAPGGDISARAGGQEVLLPQIVAAVQIGDRGPAQQASRFRHLQGARLHPIGVEVLGAQRRLALAVLDVGLGVLGEELDLGRARAVAVVS